MKKVIILTTIVLVFSLPSLSQITKGNWLVGGVGRISSQIENLNSTDVSSVSIDLSPNIGYFFLDKFAVGVKLNVGFDKVKFTGGVSKATHLGIGPFFRYYFLKTDNRVNILAETAYQYLHNTGNNGASDYENVIAFSAGPVIYFNSSVGIEFLINYEIINNQKDRVNAKTISLGVGFQIHLEKL